MNTLRFLHFLSMNTNFSKSSKLPIPITTCMDVVFAILFNKYICFLSTVKKNVNQIEVNKSKIKLLKAKIK